MALTACIVSASRAGGGTSRALIRLALLGDKSQVTGGVAAEDVIVRGHLVGSIRGLRITLQAQSHVEGDIFAQSLAIEQGAYFEGKSRRSDNPLTEITTPGANGSANVRSDSAGSPSAAPPVAAE